MERHAKAQITQEGYSVDHCWYYRLGGDILKPMRWGVPQSTPRHHSAKIATDSLSALTLNSRLERVSNAAHYVRR